MYTRPTSTPRDGIIFAQGLIDKKVLRSVWHKNGAWAWSKQNSTAHIYGYISRVKPWLVLCWAKVPRAMTVYHAGNDRKACGYCLKIALAPHWRLTMNLSLEQ